MSETPHAPDSAAAGRTLAALVEQIDAARAELARLRDEAAAAGDDRTAAVAADLRDANERLVLAALRAESIAETAVSHLDDLTRSGQRDALTDTPNRALMLDRMERAFAMARRHHAFVALLFVDLDGFKAVNDMLGHSVGDEVLKLVAHRLESVVRESDTVSRHSGDEFLVLLADVSHEADAAGIATAMLAAVAAPLVVQDRTLYLSASIGISVYPNQGDNPATLIDRADGAMYRSKKRTPGAFAFYEG